MFFTIFERYTDEPRVAFFNRKLLQRLAPTTAMSSLSLTRNIGRRNYVLFTCLLIKRNAYIQVTESSRIIHSYWNLNKPEKVNRNNRFRKLHSGYIQPTARNINLILVGKNKLIMVSCKWWTNYRHCRCQNAKQNRIFTLLKKLYNALPTIVPNP